MLSNGGIFGILGRDDLRDEYGQIFERHGNPAYQALTDTIKQTVSEVHPLIWDVLANVKVVNPSGQGHKRNRVKPQNRRKSKPKSPFKNKD